MKNLNRRSFLSLTGVAMASGALALTRTEQLAFSRRYGIQAKYIVKKKTLVASQMRDFPRWTVFRDCKIEVDETLCGHSSFIGCRLVAAAGFDLLMIHVRDLPLGSRIWSRLIPNKTKEDRFKVMECIFTGNNNSVHRCSRCGQGLSETIGPIGFGRQL